MKLTKLRQKRSSEAGFSIMEALLATMILIFGLASIFNLMIMTTTSGTVANQASAATMLAARRLEMLRATRFAALGASPGDTLENQTAPFFEITDVEGVGRFETRWRIQTMGNNNSLFIQVRSQAQGFRGRQSRAEMTSVRTCTLGTTGGCF